jgi:hypothetical protein
LAMGCQLSIVVGTAEQNILLRVMMQLGRRGQRSKVKFQKLN